MYHKDNIKENQCHHLKKSFFHSSLSSQVVSFTAFSPVFARSLFCIENGENSEKSNHMLSATSHIELEFSTKFLNTSKLHYRLFCCTRGSRYLTPRALGITPYHAVKLALKTTSSYRLCNQPGVQTDVASVQWH